MPDEFDVPGIKCLNIDEIHPEENLGDFIFTDNASAQTILQMCLNKKIRHFVQKSNLAHAQEIALAQKMAKDPDKYFSFPLSAIFGQENPDEASEKKLQGVFFDINNPTDKFNVLAQIENYIKGLTKASSLLYEVLNTADELFTNAIYNAPYMDFNNENPGVERDFRNVRIDSSKRPYMFVGNDGARIVLGCKDQFGTLNVERLLARIKKCYDSDLSNVINYSSGGAGIGAFMIFESAASVYIGVKQGIQTLVCCSFAYKLSSASRSQLPKNLHIYTE